MKYYIGQTIDQITIKEKIQHNGKTAYKCVCSCGKECIKVCSQLSISVCRCIDCGNIESGNKRRTTFNYKGTQEYRAWSNMKNRCTNPNYELYHRYGGRGIKVCDEWVNSFETFLKDMGKKPSKQHSIDRINNDLGYSKDNCKWATKKEQSNNTKNTTMVELNGVLKPLSYWCEEKGLRKSTILIRISKGMSPQDAMAQGNKHLQDRYYYTIDGVRYELLKDVSKAFNVPRTSAMRRFNSDNFPNWIKTML